MQSFSVGQDREIPARSSYSRAQQFIVGTADSDSASLGSNPSPQTTYKRLKDKHLLIVKVPLLGP